MPHDAPARSIARLRSVWEGETGRSSRRALTALVVAVVIGAAFVARLGTPAARLAAAGAMAATVVGLIARSLVLRRFRHDPRRVIRGTLMKTDPELGAAALRALSLSERTPEDGSEGSAELAKLHVVRLLGRGENDRLTERAARAGTRWSLAGLLLGGAAALAALSEPFRVVEGLDVLVARAGEAPLHLAWLADVEMASAPPEYLHTPTSQVTPFSSTSQPRGATLSVRGRALHAGRPLVLTDGTDDVPFVDDGAGGLTARWTLGDTTSLWIAAKLGEVRVRQPDAQPVVSIPDELPVVAVEGAPRTVHLLDEPSIAVRYKAVDDHGLREVDLVLRAGTREERRVLSRPAADVKLDRGGYELKANDAFFKRTYVPVEVTVEARDNDMVAGPKWGKSAAMIVVPPQVGEPEALRFEALLAARDALTDLVAYRVTAKPPGVGVKPLDHANEEATAQGVAVQAVQATLGGSYGGLTLRGRFSALAAGQLRRLAVALEAERKLPSPATHQKLLDESEEVLLALDAGLRSLGVRDTKTVAKRLASVADEAAAAAAGQGLGGEGVSAKPRLDAAIQVLGGGGTELLRLGELGRDLGEIVVNDLRRINRAREAGEMLHAELAARDLAARLRKPEPSFSGGGRAGVESGASAGSGQGESGEPGEGGEPSSADKEAAKAARDLEELERDHAAQTDEVEQALEKAASPAELEALKAEAKKHAQAIRDAVKDLPPRAGAPGSPEGAAAQGREQAESMAGSIEGGTLPDAIEKGKRAAQALAESKRAADRRGGGPIGDHTPEEAEKARGTIERELAWAEDALTKLRKAASQRAKEDLAKASQGEKKLGQRTEDMAKKGETGDRSLPQETLDRLADAERAMRDAEKALAAGEGEKGVRLQKDAQRFLEMARGDTGQEPEGEAEKDDGRAMAKRADIPEKDRHKGPDDFRRRVLQGLGSSADPLLRDAVKRYAEGLLK